MICAQVKARCGKVHSGLRSANWTDDWECVQWRIGQHYDGAAVSFFRFFRGFFRGTF